MSYRPQLDTTPELGPELASRLLAVDQYAEMGNRIIKDRHMLRSVSAIAPLGITKARAPGDGVPCFRISEQAREFKDCF